MNKQQNHATVKALATGLIVSGIVLSSLATTGCGTRIGEQVAALTSGSGQVALDQVAQKPAPTSRLSANHNETFRVAAVA